MIDAQMLGEIISTADGGCGPCVKGLAVKILRAFPEIDREVFINALDLDDDEDRRDVREALK